MMDYLRRAFKFLLYIGFFFVLFLYLIPVIQYGKPLIGSFHDLFSDQKFTLIMGLIIAYIFVFPLINFVKIQRHLNGSYMQNKEIFEKAFGILNYIKIEESVDKVVFRKKSPVARFFYWFEDQIILDITGNPVIISGIRKQVRRLDMQIDRLLRQNEQD